MTLTLLRHAAPPKEQQNRYHGWSNLSIDERLIDRHQIALLKAKKFDLIISSDLQRSIQTVETLQQPFETTKALREVAFKAEIEGKSFSEIEQLPSFKKQYLISEEHWHNYICQESANDFRRRIKAFLATLPQNKTILLCTHAGTIKEILRIVGQQPITLGYLESIEVSLD
ncbi:MAG: histidine phosphatase family protein [Campylobacterales bacterium]|nr:histidine phosphatase family protein [Campylobacterales bacterium]